MTYLFGGLKKRTKCVKISKKAGSATSLWECEKSCQLRLLYQIFNDSGDIYKFHSPEIMGNRGVSSGFHGDIYGPFSKFS